MSNERMVALSRDPRCPGFAPAPVSRRGVLQATGLGFGWAAFGAIAASAAPRSGTAAA